MCHFEMIQEMKNIKYKSDAKNLDIGTIALEMQINHYCALPFMQDFNKRMVNTHANLYYPGQS